MQKQPAIEWSQGNLSWPRCSIHLWMLPPKPRGQCQPPTHSLQLLPPFPRYLPRGKRQQLCWESLNYNTQATDSVTMKIPGAAGRSAPCTLPSQTAGCQHAGVVDGGAARLNCEAARREMGCTSQNAKIRCFQGPRSQRPDFNSRDR